VIPGILGNGCGAGGWFYVPWRSHQQPERELLGELRGRRRRVMGARVRSGDDALALGLWEWRRNAAFAFRRSFRLWVSTMSRQERCFGRD
jgi:hypothetical protein